MPRDRDHGYLDVTPSINHDANNKDFEANKINRLMEKTFKFN